MERKKRRVAEGPRPLVSFSLQQLHLLLPTAQHQRAKGPGTGARGRMSRLTLNPPAKPARLCGTLRPSFENKGEGLTLARQPPVPGWTPSLLGPFKAALRDHVQALAPLRRFKPITHGAVPLAMQRCDLAERTFLPNSELENTPKWKHR